MDEVAERLDAARALASVPVFSVLSQVDLAKLAGVLEDRWLDAGTVVFEAGGEGDALYILREGTAERRIAGTSIDLIHPPALMGELALLTDEPRSASVVALTAVRLWVLPRNQFDQVLRAEPGLMLHLSSAVGLELARTRRSLAQLQREIEAWIAERLEALSPEDRNVVEAAALFEYPPLAVLALLADVERAHVRQYLREQRQRAPLLQEEEAGWIVPSAIRAAVVRLLEAQHRKADIAARLCAIARHLEREGRHAHAAATYLAAGAQSDGERLLARLTPAERATITDTPEGTPEAAPAEAAATAVAPKRRIDRKKLAGIALSIVPLCFWMAGPPEGLSAPGWQALLTLLSAAILFAAEALPEAIVALALLGAWVVTGLVAPRVALDGFATQPWVLVLAVLAVGVAVGNTGLLYRVALMALGTKPAGFAKRCLTLALVGTAVTPTLPNATSRTALAAPMLREVAEALNYPAGSRAATGLALAGLIGFGQMSGLFLTGSSVGLLVHGLLPPEMRAEYNFLGWFLAALPLHVVLFAASMAATIFIYRPKGRPAASGDRLALQRAVLGPMRRDEKLCLAVLVALIAGFLSEPLHGINGAWLSVAALIVLAAGRALDTTMMRNGVNWPFLVFFGAITSLATVFATLKIDVWLAATLATPITMLSENPLAFCLALALAGFVLSFVVRWQAAAPLLTLVALPIAGLAHVHPFLVALISLVSTQVWFLPYQSTVYLALYHGSGELFTHRQAQWLAWLWGLLVLAAIAASVPVWEMMGLVK